ncbi:hypothetical protein GUJ93_ZPchr0001g32391 [Zizania palustris]|uniref:Uncharacterized protein n=1 Tax=Zizania palustris TaxID=103762 RepID=A0A8J5VSN3_ZIZPA|nr:hypothetical protein GUJ93_ZPchr0001g32391 [Zizania palustris]
MTSPSPNFRFSASTFASRISSLASSVVTSASASFPSTAGGRRIPASLELTRQRIPTLVSPDSPQPPLENQKRMPRWWFGGESGRSHWSGRVRAYCPTILGYPSNLLCLLLLLLIAFWN